MKQVTIRNTSNEIGDKYSVEILLKDNGLVIYDLKPGEDCTLFIDNILNIRLGVNR